MSHAPVGSDPPVRLSGEQGASPFSLPGVTPGQNDAAGGIGLGGGVRYCVCIKGCICIQLHTRITNCAVWFIRGLCLNGLFLETTPERGFE